MHRQTFYLLLAFIGYKHSPKTPDMTHLRIPFFLLCILFALSAQTAHAQSTSRSIQVKGVKNYNLSPDEIIIQLTFEEYFTDPSESPESKVTLEDIETQLRNSLSTAGVKEDKITVGGIQVVQPYLNRKKLRRRLNKTLFICIGDTEDYIRLTRELERANLLDDIIKKYSISEFRHTKREEYLKLSHSEAFQDARNKAELILASTEGKLGKVISIKEISNQVNTISEESFYSLESPAGSASGFRPIVINYSLLVTFEIE